MDDETITIKFYSEGRWQSYPMAKAAAYSLLQELYQEFVGEWPFQSEEKASPLKVLVE